MWGTKGKSRTLPTKLHLLADRCNAKEETVFKEECTFSNVNLFVVNIFVLNCARIAGEAYLGGSIRTIERKLGFGSTATGVIVGFLDVMHSALLLFLGYAGRTWHKRKMIAIASVFPVVSTQLMAMVYFIVPPLPNELEFSRENSTDHIGNASKMSGSLFTRWQMCDQFTSGDHDCKLGLENANQNSAAYALFLVASLLFGVGGSATTVLAMGFAVRVRSVGQKYGPACHQRNRADVTEFVTLVRLSSVGQHVGVLALAGHKRRKSALTAGPIPYIEENAPQSKTGGCTGMAVTERHAW